MARPKIGSRTWGIVLNQDLNEVEAKADAALAVANSKLSGGQIGAAGGIASLDGAGQVPAAQIPNLPAGKITSGTVAQGRLPAHLEPAALSAAYVSATIAVGAGIDTTGAAGSRNALQAKMDAINAFGGGELVIPRGTYKIESPLYARSNVCVRLQEGAHLLRGYAAGSPMICNQSLTPEGKISNFSIVGPGKVGAPNTIDGGQTIFLYGDDLLLSDFTIDTYGGTSGSQALLIGGDRNRLLGIRILNPADLAGAGGVRMFGGKHFRAVGCHVVAGDDALQFTPIATGALANLSIEDGAYIGCTGGSTEARFMVAILSTSPPGSGGMTASIRNVAWIGCHGFGQKSGAVIANTDSTGEIANVDSNSCSIDMAGAITTTQEVRIERGTGAGRVRNIRLNGMRIANPTTTAVQVVGHASSSEFVEDVTLTDCQLGGPANGASTVALHGVDGFTIRGGKVSGATSGTADYVIEGGTGDNASRRVHIHGPRITDVRDGFAAIRLPETVGYQVRDCQITPVAGGTTGQGVSLAAATSGGTIEGNDLSALPGTKVAGTIAAGTIIRNNAGLVTRASGTATISTGGTQIAVAHGLGRTPAIKDILVTPSNSVAAQQGYYVSAANGTTFTIAAYFESTTAPSAMTYTWSADVSVA